MSAFLGTCRFRKLRSLNNALFSRTSTRFWEWEVVFCTRGSLDRHRPA